MSPIQQMFLGINPATGDSYWWQKCDLSDYANTTGWSGYGATIIADDDENSYFFAQSSSNQRPHIFGFDKDGANIVKSYGGDWVNSGTTIPSNKKFGNFAQSGFIFDNKLYFAGQGLNVVGGDSSASVIELVNVASGQTPSGHKQHVFAISGDSKNHGPAFLVGRLGSGLTHCVAFDGSNDKLSIPDSTDFEFGNGDFTVEAWIKQSNAAGTGIDAHTIANKWDSGGSDKEWIFRINGDYLQWLQTENASTNQITTGNTTITVGQWHHVAVVGHSGTIKLFVDGIQQSSTGTQGTIHDGNNPLILGFNESSPGGQWMDGSISNCRIVKGTAVYTANFAPSVEPLTNITNTKLLCCNGSSTTSSTVTPGTITASGGPTVAQNCPLSSSYLCGGDMINKALTPNTTRCPYFFKSSVDLTTADYTDNDVFYAKREDPNSTYFTSGGYEAAAITSDGLYAYLAGICGSNSTQGGGGNTSGGSWGGVADAYLLKINYATGALITRACFPTVGPSSGTSMFFGIAIDSSGNIYCAGKTKQSYSGDKAYIIKLNSSMVVQWQKYISDITYIQKLVVDSSGNVYGVTTGGGQYGYIIKFTSSGTIDWSTKITINGFTDRSPFLKGLEIKGENENLYTSFTYNMNPSSTSPSTTYRTQFACIKYPNTGNVTGTYGDLVFTAGSLSTSDATMGTRTGNYVDSDERQQNIYQLANTNYGNGNPTITKTNL